MADPALDPTQQLLAILQQAAQRQGGQTLPQQGGVGPGAFQALPFPIQSPGQQGGSPLQSSEGEFPTLQLPDQVDPESVPLLQRLGLGLTEGLQALARGHNPNVQVQSPLADLLERRRQDADKATQRQDFEAEQAFRADVGQRGEQREDQAILDKQGREDQIIADSNERQDLIRGEARDQKVDDARIKAEEAKNIANIRAEASKSVARINARSRFAVADARKGDRPSELAPLKNEALAWIVKVEAGMPREQAIKGYERYLSVNSSELLSEEAAEGLAFLMSETEPGPGTDEAIGGGGFNQFLSDLGEFVPGFTRTESEESTRDQERLDAGTEVEQMQAALDAENKKAGGRSTGPAAQQLRRQIRDLAAVQGGGK